MSKSGFERILVFILLLSSFGGPNGPSSVSASVDVPQYFFSLSAPWPAGVVLHAGGDGYGFGPTPTHKGNDLYAVDFNGYPGNEDPPVETADKDLLVLSVADGCVKEVKYHPGYVKDGEWKGNYGWSVVILHPGGYQSRYAHLKDKPLVPMMSYSPDQCYFIAKGQPIGQVGGTGTNAKDSVVHLHFAFYHCKPSGNSCKIEAAKPDPIEGVNLPSGLGTPVRVTSQNYSVGYEAIKGNGLTNPSSLSLHRPILNLYKAWGGQTGFFGHATGPVEKVPGTEIYYQEFQKHELQSIIAGTIVEVNSLAFLLPKPIWDMYRGNHAKFGYPNSSTYITRLGDGEAGWRVDFQNASLFWDTKSPEPTVWDEKNAAWKVIFCPGTNNFTCNPVRRRDPAIDVSISDSNNPGPLSGTQGFSMLMEATFKENWISKISLEYILQGNVRFYIEDRYEEDWISSEDGVRQGITSPSWHVGENTFRVRFWQSPGKNARLSMKIHENGFNLIPVAHAFNSPGTLESTAFQTSQPEYLDFEPPLYPADAGSEEAPPEEVHPDEPTPGQPTETPPDDIFPIELPDIGKWWEETLKKIQDGIDQWWQDLTDEVQKRIEEEIMRMLQEALDSLVRQCTGTYILSFLLGISTFMYKRHR